MRALLGPIAFCLALVTARSAFACGCEVEMALEALPPPWSPERIFATVVMVATCSVPVRLTRGSRSRLARWSALGGCFTIAVLWAAHALEEGANEHLASTAVEAVAFPVVLGVEHLAPLAFLVVLVASNRLGRLVHRPQTLSPAPRREPMSRR